ncbi:MAG: hypothetical protein RIR12_28 [Bacteroidota bacterium]|jgi:hypothetical protein
MNIKTALLKEHSKTQTNQIVAWIGSDQIRFNSLFALFTSDNYRLVQRSAWPLGYAVLAHPFLIKKHYALLFKKLEDATSHDAVKRNTLRILQEIDVPKKYHGTLMHLCFNFINTPTEKTAIRSFALTVLHRLSKTYTEIIPEIKTIIAERWTYETPSFKSRATRFINDLPTHQKD